ncbi:MAG: LLM class flavin-dependent oxidoreductase [bacterium]|nr:LLM class flavin-dependent oxidoreductase [bacterium]
MEFAIALATSTESWKAAKRAEKLGFSHAWFYDTQLLNPDVFIAMTQAAMHTERIRLGTGVLIPSNRIEPVTANAFASLNKIAPGRIDFGVGTGFTGRRTMGLGALPLARMKTYVQRVQALLRGETIEWDFEGKTRKIRFLNPDFGLINLDDDIPLHVSAMGPKARRVTAELGGGWLDFGGLVEPAIVNLADMQSAWKEAGRTEPLHSTLFIVGCVLQPGEALDSERVLAQAGPWVSVMMHNLVESTEPGSMAGLLPPVANEALERYREIHRDYHPEDARYLSNHRGHLMFQRPEEQALMSAELIETLAGFVATPDVLRERIRALSEAGYSQIAIQLIEHHEDALEEWAEVFDGI